MDYLSAIRKQKPMIHNITNIVVANFSANGLLALGASPAMANAPEEVEEMVSHADALVLNIGTCTQTQVEAMLTAGKAANEKGIPVILDPVAVGATNFRKNAIQQILAEVDVAVIRGNTGEIAYLGELSVEMKGADALLDEIAPDVAIETAKKYGAIVIATGRTDIITDGENYTLCKNGVSMLPYVTGSGCLLTAIVGAFVSVSDDCYQGAVQAVTSYGIAAELAWKEAQGPGTFLSAFLDELYQITDPTVLKHRHIEEFTKQGGHI